MVRGVSSVSTNGSSQLVLKTGKKAQKVLTSNVKNEVKKFAGEIGLPAKVVLSLMGIYGTDKAIGERESSEIFKMSCDDFSCGEDYINMIPW